MAGTVVNSAISVTGVQNGGGGSGYLVQSGSLTATNATFMNYKTVGGAGSGGGGGLGGAIFVNDGATVTLTNTTFLGNTAQGGLGGVGTTGGVLNGLMTPTSNGANGGTGDHFIDSDFQVGDGSGNGVGGQSGYDAGDATNGFGGRGGDGGFGTNGWDHNPIMQEAVATASTAVALATLDQIKADLELKKDTQDCASFDAASAAALADPITAPMSPAFISLGEAACEKTIEEIIDVVATGVNLAAATADLTFASGELAHWNSGNNRGDYGIGGDGGTGGNGGAGSFGFGGGAGGNGGANGAGGLSADAPGAGGSGGTGGDGGFGAGGGAGGVGVVVPKFKGHDFSGDDGAGGLGGFGGGVGATGGTDGGGGGSGFGGSIFVATGGTLTLQGNAYFNRGNVVAGKGGSGGLAGEAAGTDLFMMAGSTVTLDPGAGNVQTFNGTIADDSITSIGSATENPDPTESAGLSINSGLVIFNNYNTYGGTTVLNGGVLQAFDGVGLPTNSNLDFNGGVFQTSGTFDRFVGTYSDQVQWTGSGGFAAVNGALTVSLSGNGQLVWDQGSFVPGGSALIFGSPSATDIVTFTNDIDLNGGNRTILVQANDGNTDGAILTGVLSNGALTIGDSTHTGILTLTGVNTYAGTTTINAGSQLLLTGSGSIANSAGVNTLGTLDISGTSGASLTTLSGSGNVVLGAQTLTLTAAADTFSGVVSGNGGLTVAAGTETLTGTNTYTGRTTVNGGATLVIGVDGSVSTSSGVTDNGNLDVSTNGATIKTLSGSGTVALGDKTLTLTSANDIFTGVVGGTGIVHLTGGNETFTGTNTYTGRTIIDAGTTLALSGTGSIATSSGVTDNGTFDISANTTGASIQTLSGTGSVVLGSKALTLTNASETFAGIISGTGPVHLTGGTETLTGTNSYTGTTTIDSGTSLILTGTGAIASSSNVIDNGTFDIAGTSAGASIVTLSGSGATTLGSQTLTLTNASTTYSGSIGGTGGVTVAGGTETLTGSNTYTGNTIINSGATLALSGSGSIANSARVTDNGTFNISATTAGASIKTLTGNGNAVLGSQTLTLTAANDTFAGVLSGTGGGFTVAAGTETLTGTNTYTGATSVSSGATLNLSGSGSVATSSGVTDNGTFDISATTAGASIKSLAGSGSLVLGSKALTLTNASGNFGGVVSGSGTVTVSGGSETLSGINTYTGGTTINSGATLALSGSGSIATSSGVTDNGTFDISATTSGASIKTLSGAGGVTLGSKTLTLTNAAGTFSGIIGGTGGVALTSGSESFTGVNTYSGGTSLTNSTLTVNSNAALGAASGPIALNGGKLVTTTDITMARNIALTGTNNTLDTHTQFLTLNGVISGTGGFIADGGGTIALNGTNTYSGGTTVINATKLIIGSDAALGAASGPLVIDNGQVIANGNFTSTRPITINANGKFDNSGGFNVNLTGLITLNNGSGPATVFTGTTAVSGPWTLSALTGLVISGTGTLSGVGTVTDNTTINGTLAPGNSPGTIIFAAPVTMTSGSILALDVDGPGTGTGAGNYDRVVVTGAGNTFTAGGTIQVKLRGITGSANNTFTPVVGQRFNVLHTDAGVTGSFAGLTQPSTGLLTGTQIDTIYSASDMDLVVTPVSYANLTPLGVTDTDNRKSLGNAINSYRLAPGIRATGDRNPVTTALYSLPASGIAAPMDQIAGTVHGDVLTASLSLNQMFGMAVGDHRNGLAITASAKNPAAYAGLNTRIKPAQLSSDSPWWMTGFGQFTNTATDGNAPGYHFNGGGFVAGVDLASSPDLTAGLAGGYSQATVTTKNGATATVQAERVVGYGDLKKVGFRFDGEIGFSINQYDDTRQIQVGTLSRIATGNSTGWSFAGDVAAHYTEGKVQPFVELRFDHVARSAFTETGAGDIGLNVLDENLSTGRTLLGFDVDLLSGTHAGVNSSINVRMAWAHDIGRYTADTDATLVGSPGTVFQAASSVVGRDAGLANVSFITKLSDQISLYGEYHVEARTRAVSQTGSAGLRLNW